MVQQPIAIGCGSWLAGAKHQVTPLEVLIGQRERHQGHAHASDGCLDHKARVAVASGQGARAIRNAIGREQAQPGLRCVLVQERQVEEPI